MGQKPGFTGNPNGRPKGSKNQKNVALRVTIQNFLEGNFEQIIQDFQALEPAQRIRLYTDLLPYALPRLEAVPVNETELSIDYLSPEALEQLTQHIKNQSNEN